MVNWNFRLKCFQKDYGLEPYCAVSKPSEKDYVMNIFSATLQFPFFEIVFLYATSWSANLKSLQTSHIKLYPVYIIATKTLPKYTNYLWKQKTCIHNSLGFVNQIHIKGTGILHHYREISILAEDCCPLLCHQLPRHDRTKKKVVQAEGIAKSPGLKTTEKSAGSTW